jgi:hypothetical protein
MKVSAPNFSKWAIASLFLSLLWSCQPEQNEEVQTNAPEEILAPENASGKFPYRRLSTYGFFEGELAQLAPSEAIIPYQPASSLFTDYALKSRFAYLPEGKKAVLDGEELNLPQALVPTAKATATADSETTFRTTRQRKSVSLQNHPSRRINISPDLRPLHWPSVQESAGDALPLLYVLPFESTALPRNRPLSASDNT